MKNLHISTKIVIAWTLWTILLIVGALLNAGCITIEEEHDCDDAVVIDPPTSPARLNLTFSGPPSGEIVAVGAENAEVLCFNATATRHLEVQKLRLMVHDGDGMIFDLIPQYSDIKIVEDGIVVEGPVELAQFGYAIEQTVIMHDPIDFQPDVPRAFCVKLDVHADARLHGHNLSVSLLPFETGDVVLADDGSALAAGQITPMDGLWTVLAVRIESPLVPINPPRVSAAPVPTNVLTNGMVAVHRETIVAPAGSDVMLKKLSYTINVSASNPSAISLDSANLRVVGDGFSLGGWSDVLWYSGDCGFTATWSTRCARVILEQPLVIPAGTSVTVELRLNVSGPLAIGDAITTGADMDPWGHQEGPLGAGPYIESGVEDGVLWSNDGLWWYNGHSVDWGTPFAQTLTR